jgi:hypothetical protein
MKTMMKSLLVLAVLLVVPATSWGNPPWWRPQDLHWQTPVVPGPWNGLQRPPQSTTGFADSPNPQYWPQQQPQQHWPQQQPQQHWPQQQPQQHWPQQQPVVPQQQIFNYSIAIQNSLQTPVNYTVDGTAYTTQPGDTGNFWNQNYNGAGYTFTVIFEDGTGADTWITEHVPAGAVNLAFEIDDNGAIALFWD